LCFDDPDTTILCRILEPFGRSTLPIFDFDLFGTVVLENPAKRLVYGANDLSVS
jgi:hypothetical protein